MSSQQNIAGIVLAAGQSKRMGQVNKLLADFDGKPMIVRTLEIVAQGNFSQVVVVTGYKAAETLKALDSFKVEFAFNNQFENGLSKSLKTGIAHLNKNCDGVMVFLGDMPQISADVIDRLVAGFHGSSCISVPVHEGKKGNPILWGKDYFCEMMDIKGDKGARELLKTHAEKMVETSVENSGILNDFDAPSDFEN